MEDFNENNTFKGKNDHFIKEQNFFSIFEKFLCFPPLETFQFTENGQDWF